MATVSDAISAGTIAPRKRRALPTAGRSGRWWRFVLFLFITGIALVPVAGVLVLSVRPGRNSTSTAPVTLDNFAYIFANTQTLQWLVNSLIVTFATVLVSVAVGAPAGYVLARGRSRAVSGYSLLLFVVQALPVITAVIPLFILFAKLGLVDNLVGIAIIYVGVSTSVATWMMSAYMSSIPEALEQAAWIDGCSVFGGFLRIVLRNSLPGILSTAIFTFIVSWNDYLIALVFLRSAERFTMPIGLASFFQRNVTDWGSVMAVAVIMLAPPLILFSVLNKYFSIGGIGGSLAGQ